MISSVDTISHHSQTTLKAVALLLIAAGLSPDRSSAQTTGDCNLGTATVDLDIRNVRARM
jgi:hypothetical protein